MKDEQGASSMTEEQEYDDDSVQPLKDDDFLTGLAVLNHVVFGRNPSTGRSVSAPRRRDRAEELAEAVETDIVEPIRTALESLNSVISDALCELENAASTADELREAENGDDREEAYSELDEHLNAVRTALSEMGVDIRDTWKPKGGKKTTA